MNKMLVEVIIQLPVSWNATAKKLGKTTYARAVDGFAITKSQVIVTPDVYRNRIQKVVQAGNWEGQGASYTETTAAFEQTPV